MNISRRVAFCGVVCALSTVWLLLTAFPYATIALTAIAGLMLVPAGLELGSRYGYACFGVTAVLALLIVPEMSAKGLFVLFFGYYPLIQLRVNLWYKTVWKWIVKYAVFNAAFVMACLLATTMIGDVKREFWTHPAVLALIVSPLANVVFTVYDIVLWRVIGLYRLRLHPIVSKYLR